KQPRPEPNRADSSRNARQVAAAPPGRPATSLPRRQSDREKRRSNALPMFQPGHVAPHASGDFWIEPSRRPPRSVGHFGDGVTPWVGDHRMTISEPRLALALQVLAPGGRRGEPALRFDGTSTDQRFPVI